MSFKYLQLAFNDDCMIELYYKGFSSQVARFPTIKGAVRLKLYQKYI